MGTIKLKRGTGSPAGSIAANEVAMDVAAKNLYTSTDGSDAVVLADNTENFLETNTTELDITSDIDMNDKDINGISQLAYKLGGADPSITYPGNSGSAFNFQSLKINTVHDPSLTPDLSASNGTFQISNYTDAGNNFLNRFELQTGNRKPFFGIFVEDTGGGDDGSHSTIFSLKGSDSSSVYNQLQSFTSASGTPGPTRLDITGSAVSFYGDEYRLPTADGTADQFLKTDGAGNLTFSTEFTGVTNNAVSYNDVFKSIRDDSGGGFSKTAMEVIRDLGSDGATSGIDPRGAMFGFTIHNDSGNTNGANSPAQYLGGIQGKSGSGTNDNSSPHWMEAFTYNASFAEQKLWDGTVNEFNIYPATEFHAPVQFKSYTTTERNALTAVNGMQIYNSTDSKMQAYAGGAWVDLH